MTDFLSASDCRGRKPKCVITGHHRHRADLHAKMQRYRRRIRFIIAPSLFGKTVLAAEYADQCFSFNHVYWINGRSPCFLRELDKDAIAPSLLAKEGGHALVVFDDMPYLEGRRESQAEEMLDAFISRGWEVIVTMAPGHDMLRHTRGKSLCIQASDLLLTDAEIDACRSDTQVGRRSAASFSQVERIPGLFWSEKVDYSVMLGSALEGASSDEAVLAVFAMVMLRQGDFDDFGLFASGLDEDIPVALCDYLYLGIDAQARSFDCHAFPIEVVAKAFSPRLQALASASAFPDRDTLVMHVADAMLDRGDAERACAAIGMMCAPSFRAQWLARRSGGLFEKGCIMPAHLVHESLHSHAGLRNGLLQAVEIWRLAMLGERDKPMRSALRLCQSAESGVCAQKLSCLFIVRYGDEDQASRAISTLEEVLGKARLSGRSHPVEPTDALHMLVTIVAEGVLKMRRGFGSVCEFLHSLHGTPIEDRAVSVVLSWMAEQLRLEGGAGPYKAEGREGRIPSEVVEEFARFVSGHIAQRIESGDFGFLDALLVIELEKSDENLGCDALAMPSDPISAEISRYEMSLTMQRKAFREERESQNARRAVYRRTHPDELGTDGDQIDADMRPHPILRVHLFGGLEVFIGDEVIDPKLFSRQKVKALLALLMLNQGKELPRERLCRLLWPESDEVSAQHNLYSIWSLLKKALALPDRSCPYLIRTQFSYKVDTELVSSDVADLARLCRTLQFGQVQGREWPSVFALLNDRYTGDLLPTETRNEAIIHARRESRSRLVDALAAAALRQYEAKDLQTASLLARAVLARDASREDVYTLLMQTQIALGQRTAALDTFFRCRKYLSEQLGMDPSSKTRSLYLGILEEEPVLLPGEPLDGASSM